MTVASSGHRYFTLTDQSAVIACVMWKSRHLDESVAEGVEVIATGSISVYPPRGTYQLDCSEVHARSTGKLAADFEALKRKLEAEGLFDHTRKRALPWFPQRIGVVTSPTGAALRDILDTLERRMPTVEVLLSPSRVQGIGAADEIASSLQRLYREPPDVIIVGRGGGSAEDLSQFNDEQLARVIADSPVPIISAVGHEIDFSISDFVADVRAATPTAAAELAVPERGELLETIRTLQREVASRLTRLSERLRFRFELLAGRPGMSRPKQIVHEYAQVLDEATRRAADSLNRQVARRVERLDNLERQLRALDPDSILRRGYAAIEQGEKPVSSATHLSTGDTVRIRFHDGSKNAVITREIEQNGEEEG